ncbi:amidohydrolase family protein [Pannus brasiliensis CCIBt3594]|uniref:Amidohydrolase family protein n=1 Tax=Pannus brasiliensis CCIBt3594 TaxID=1427578 RepID=A0AAW9QR46_9CHRO
MLKSKFYRIFLASALTSIALLPVSSTVARSDANPRENQDSVLMNDVHFHLDNYIQEGIPIGEFLKLMGDKVGRVAIFGIPLQQKWDYFVDGDRSPDYYLLSDTELYYYSFVDAIVATEYLKLSPEQRKRFDPMITGFNPTDMYATDHIKRVLKIYPGVFSGIGEFTIHKEFVSPKVAGHTASLKNEALNRVFSLAGDIGLAVLIHCDIDTNRPAPGPRPAYLDDLKTLFRSHPKTTIIWAHTGLGRTISPRPEHLQYLAEILSDPAYNNVVFDISWDEVAKYVIKDPETTRAWANLLNKYPDRFLFGSDAVAPKTEAAYLKTYQDYAPLWKALDPKTSYQIRIGNYERIFDTARQKVRSWEQKQVSLDSRPALSALTLAETPSFRAAFGGSCSSPLIAGCFIETPR